ncbi:unnamed protein product [Spirodela intermedia]|uniref:Uncharacterized protein n=1 Tax=Spirodela intermedia TaxID=51605 RepID=A0A7I8L2Z6_SPIIN|nr:unnamed protein product [Spirodela intermedia]
MGPTAVLETFGWTRPVNQCTRTFFFFPRFAATDKYADAGSGRYVRETTPLSLYRANPGEKAAVPPPPLPEGPHSGYLVIQDEEYEAQSTCCWGLCRNPYLVELPFPQNRLLIVEYSHIVGEGRHIDTDHVFFVPVPGHPISANRYYVVLAGGNHAGEICACSREQDRTTFCCCFCVHDVKPRPFREGDVYQEVEVIPHRRKGEFHARAIAPDGIPPLFLRQQCWTLRRSLPRDSRVDIGSASGVDRALREKRPDVSFPIAGPSSAAVLVGKWYSPFFFTKEESRHKDQMKRSVYYEVTLEQFWEPILTRENPSGAGGSRRVEVKATVQTESAFLSNGEPVGEELSQPDGFVLFRPAESGSGAVALSSTLMERMKWELARGSWVPGKDGVEVVDREEEYQDGGEWAAFGCYLLVERFSLRRLDGSLVLARDFRHTDKIITKWE